MPVYKILLKFPIALEADQLIRSIQDGTNGAVVCHKLEEHEDKEKGKEIEKQENKNNTKGKKDKKSTDKNDQKQQTQQQPAEKKESKSAAASASSISSNETSSVMIELVATSASIWGKIAAIKENQEAVVHAVGDIPHENPDKLSSSEIILLLQNHIHEKVFGALDKLFGFDLLKNTKTGMNNAPSSPEEHAKRKKNRQRHEELVSLVELIPIHDEAEKLSCFSWIAPVSTENIQKYYGDGPAFYNAWVNFYGKFLTFPAAFGFGIFLYNWFTGETVNDNPLVPLFSIVTIFWTILFVKFWDRRASSLACKFRSVYAKEVEVIRPQFRGEYLWNDSIQRYEKYYSSMKRLKYQFLSFLVTGFMLCVALGVQICSLNLQGYMRGKHALLEVHFFADFADPGAIFDPESNLSMIPIVLHSVTIMGLNEIYKHFARKLTELENYKTQTEWENAMIIKRVSFEFLDCFLILFYVAFYRLDIMQLRQELISLYMVDQVRRVSVETLLPLVQSYFVKKLKERKNGGHPAHHEKEHNVAIAEHAEEEIAEYESFDDYMELTMQLGYVSLFAAAFPLAGLCSLVGNLIEIRSDMFKLTHLTRRPVVHKTNNIGTWRVVMKLFAYLSIITNSLLFGFTSDQMRYYFPDLFDVKTHEIISGDGKFVVAIVFICEHVLFFLVLILDFVIPDSPEKIENEMKARKLRYVNTNYNFNSNNNNNKTDKKND